MYEDLVEHHRRKVTIQSHFYKTVVGAQVANVLVSVLATTDHAGSMFMTI